MILNAILKSIPDTIVAVDNNLNIINANNSLSEICFSPDKNNKVDGLVKSQKLRLLSV